MRHLGVLLDLGDAQLFLNGEGVEEIAAEDERVLGGENGVDPAGGDEEGVALFDDNSATLLHLVSEEDVGLPARQCPLFVFLKRTESSIANQNQGGIAKKYYGIPVVLKHTPNSSSANENTNSMEETPRKPHVFWVMNKSFRLSWFHGGLSL